MQQKNNLLCTLQLCHKSLDKKVIVIWYLRNGFYYPITITCVCRMYRETCQKLQSNIQIRIFGYGQHQEISKLISRKHLYNYPIQHQITVEYLVIVLDSNYHPWLHDSVNDFCDFMYSMYTVIVQFLMSFRFQSEACYSSTSTVYPRL
jgi:hypothetical protein